MWAGEGRSWPRDTPTLGECENTGCPGCDCSLKSFTEQRPFQKILLLKKRADFPLPATWYGGSITSLTPHTGLKGHPVPTSGPSSSSRVLGQALYASLFWVPTGASLATKIQNCGVEVITAGQTLSGVTYFFHNDLY